MQISKHDQLVIPWVMKTPRKDPYAKNRWLAQEFKQFGRGSKGQLAKLLGVPNSAVTMILQSKREISVEEGEIIDNFVDQKLNTIPGASKTPRKAHRKSTIGEVQVVGYVTAGGQEHRLPLPSEDLDTVTAPENVTNQTVAVQIRGKSMGSLFDRWYAFYDDIRSPFTDDLVGQLCVVGLPDGRVMIKKISHSRKAGHFNLLSETEPPIREVTIDWAAKVKSIAPR